MESPGPLTLRERGLGPFHTQGRPWSCSRGPSSCGIFFRGFAFTSGGESSRTVHACCPCPKPCGGQALSWFSLIN